MELGQIVRRANPPKVGCCRVGPHAKQSAAPGMILSGDVLAIVEVMAGVSSVLLNKTFQRNGGIFAAIIPTVVWVRVPRTIVCAADKRPRTFTVIVTITLSFPTGPVS